ncbi:enolase (DUF1399) [Rhynchospora pubera]|uniref:Enolase (DUF1399) n=1 Tax=Rhynchospora pubera TaxID=906938 RepID=A0AAV8DPG3_9POAL|nr:enolase (DUF1399) [Rhynchospora pubera]
MRRDDNKAPAIASSPSFSFSGESSRAPARSESSRSTTDAGRGPHRGIRTSVDLVAAGRCHFSFLRLCSAASVSDAGDSSLLRTSIRRYEELWMPLIAELPLNEMILPPLDVHWVWHCHCLNHVHYMNYCNSRFGKLIDRPPIFDEENEEYATERCREIWEIKYPGKPFDVICSSDEDVGMGSSDICNMVEKCKSLSVLFSDVFMSETVYLVAAKSRYQDFLHLLKQCTKESNILQRLVPTADIHFIWLTHQSFPVGYAKDTKEMGELAHKIAGFYGPSATEEEIEETKKFWEEVYDEPYERPGMVIDPTVAIARQVFNWEMVAPAEDVNRVYKGLHARFLMEVGVFLKGEIQVKENPSQLFLRLKVLRCNRSLKLDKNISNVRSFGKWEKVWHLFCEFGTKGVLIESRYNNSGCSCIRQTKLIDTVSFTWHELARATNLVMVKNVGSIQGMVSATPPIQAPYLLKCVPDRVTDDGGAMVCDVVLRERAYRPQEGRWLTRTVLNHAGKECFVVRTRVGRGIWRRGAEIPNPVKWEERIIELREGNWTYIGGSSMGYAPEKIIGTATPQKDNPKDKKVVWSLSTGDCLTIMWENKLQICLENETSKEKASLLEGRRLQYQPNQHHLSENNKRYKDEDIDYFTLIRPSLYKQEGKATALINLKLLALEFSPEEDAAVLILMCMALVRTLSEVRKEDLAGLLVRHRVQEMQVGLNDWGSILLPSTTTPHLQHWYFNASEVLASAEKMNSTGASIKYAAAEGKEELYRQAILS